MAAMFASENTVIRWANPVVCLSVRIIPVVDAALAVSILVCLLRVIMPLA